MMHTIRLLLSGKSLMDHGRPIIRFEGEPLALLMSIREGRKSFDEIMTLANSILEDCDRLKKGSSLPEDCDPERATALLQTITSHWEH